MIPNKYLKKTEMNNHLTVTNKNNKTYTLVSFIRGTNEFKKIESGSGKKQQYLLHIL